MKYEVYIDMKNDNALCTISMLSALLETQGGNYYNLLAPFILYSLPDEVGARISVSEITESMKAFGFIDFPQKLTERLLSKLCREHGDGKTYVQARMERGKKIFFAADIYHRDAFDARKEAMRKKLDGILKEIQRYFETHFYHKTIPVDDIRIKLTSFFSANGFTVIKDIDELRMIKRETGSASFEIAHFILEEYEKQSVIYSDLCDVTKGFLTYKGLYYFLNDQKNDATSKFKNVTFYLDCSLVLDLLDYDTTADFNAISELIRLVRRCGGQVAVFRHTTEEAAKLIEAFAYQPHYRNGFRLDNLAAKEFSREMLLAVAKDIPKTLKDKAKVDTVDAPSFSDSSNYKNILGEEEIVDWLTRNRQNGNGSDGEDERYKFDAKSLIAIGMCRREHRPHYIEQAKAMIVTQDPWLNRCLKDLYKDQFKNEVLYSITDTELVSLLWLQDYKQRGNLPSDILIANAHAACRVSTDVMNRAMQLADKMAESGTIPSDAALLVSSRSDFKGFIAERVRNDASRLDDEAVRSAVEDYIFKTATDKIQTARDEEREQAQKELAAQKDLHARENEEFEYQMRDKNNIIKNLEDKLAARDQRIEQDAALARIKKCNRAEKKAKRIKKLCHTGLYSLFILFAICLIAIFAIHCFKVYTEDGNWLPYAIVDIGAFAGCPILFISKKSLFYKLICRISDEVYSRVYTKCLNEED